MQNHRMGCAQLASLTMLFTLSALGSAISEEFQAVSVEKQDALLLEVDWYQSLCVTPSIFTDTSSVWQTTQTLALSLDYGRLWYLEASIPVVVWAGALDETGDWWASAALGDPSLQIGGTWRWASGKLMAAQSVSVPLGIWNPYETDVRRVCSGSGYATLHSSCAAILFLDPAIVQATVSYSLGLPRTGRFVSTWKPGDVSLELSIMEALNDRLAMEIAVAQDLDAGPAIGSMFLAAAPAYALDVAGGVILSTGDLTLRIEIQQPLTPALVAPTLRITVGREASLEDDT
jgi:hypothetical protein